MNEHTRTEEVGGITPDERCARYRLVQLSLTTPFIR